MKIKRYEGQYVQEVIAQIRDEMGPDAVVLHTRWRSQNGLKRLLGKPQVEVWAGTREEVAKADLATLTAAARAEAEGEVTAGAPLAGLTLDAVDDPEPARPRPQPAAPPAAAPRRPQPLPAPAAARDGDDIGALVAAFAAFSNGQLREPTNGHLAAPAPAPAPVVELLPARTEPQPAEELPETADDLTVALLAQFGDALNRIEEKVDALATPAAPAVEEVEPERLTALLQAGVDPQVARELHDAAAGGSVAEVLYDTFQCCPPLNWSQGCRVVALVGPSGVGKTTTVAKLAGHYGIREGARVLLASTDVQRIGTFEQIKALGQLMEVATLPLRTPAEAQGKLATARRQYDLVLVDTAACQPQEGPAWEHLLDTLIAVEPDEIHVVVSAAMKTKEAARVVDYFRQVLPVHGAVVTKLDEAADPGLVVDLAWRCLVPLSYLGVGHTIPGDLELATPDRLLEMIWAARQS
ncbi:MAG: hypothetical protein IT204_22955 [Fimbriimonadaceae bacterium]|nr:hypothetical protein [Fimbriimonadaceae bacterium]